MQSSASSPNPVMDPKTYDLTVRGEIEPAETLAQKGITQPSEATNVATLRSRCDSSALPMGCVGQFLGMRTPRVLVDSGGLRQDYVRVVWVVGRRGRGRAASVARRGRGANDRPSIEAAPPRIVAGVGY